MKSSYQIFQIRGIKVRIHITLLILLLLPITALSSSETPEEGIASMFYLFGILVLLFGSVLVHELSHSFVAMRNGIKVSQIVLWPLGGIASVGLVTDPNKEFKISIAGPLASFAIGFGLLFILFLAFGQGPLMQAILTDQLKTPSLFDIAVFAMYMNIILGAFNLFLPIFPMDGGRVLRSLLGMIMNRVTATKVAVGIGQGFLGVFIVLSLFYGIWLWVAIGVFLLIAGLSELKLTEMGEAAEHRDLERAVKTDFMVLDPKLKTKELMQLAVKWQSIYPVIDANARVLGVVEPAGIKDTAGRVGDIMQTDYPKANLGENKEELVGKVYSNGYAIVLEGEKLHGVLTLQNLQKELSN